MRRLLKCTTKFNYSTRNLSSSRFNFQSPGISATSQIAGNPSSIPETTSEILTSAAFDQFHSTFIDAGLTTLGRTGFSQLLPTGLIEHGYQFLIESSGVDWLIGIPCATIVLRTCLIPFQIRNQVKTKSDMYNSQKKMMELREKQISEIDPEKKYELELEIQQQNINSVNPFGMILRMLPTAVVMSSHFIGLRNIANSGLESINTTYLPWVENGASQQLILKSLAESDPLFILPATASVLTAYTIMRGLDESVQNMPMASKNMLYKFGSVMGFVTFLFVASQSATVSIMFATNATISILVGSVLKIESVQKMVGLYRDPDEQKMVVEFMRLEMDRNMKMMAEARQAQEQSKIYENLAKQRIEERGKEQNNKRESEGQWK